MLFARKDETVSTLQSKYNGRTGAMSIDNFARWLNRVTLAVAIIMIGWGISVIFTQPVTAWFATSSMIWMALLLISAIWQLVTRLFAKYAREVAKALPSGKAYPLRGSEKRTARASNGLALGLISGFGTFEICRPALEMSVNRVIPEDICSR